MSKKINRVGERNLANNGQWMEIIEYINSHNITVKFEDGTIVYNKQYDKFIEGKISNPNYVNFNKIAIFIDRTGKTNVANNGQKMTIIAYRRSKDIDVQFEDGTIIYHRTYDEFKKGKIKNPNYKNSNPHYNFKNRIGEENIANNGQKMIIIAYRGYNDIDVQFEDGTVVYNKSYVFFKKGEIVNPNYKIAIGISVNEFTMYWYLKKYGFIKAERGTLKNLGFGRMELDCYHPDYKIAIEYDGGFHETTINKDKRKNKICKQNGITIIRIREPKCPVLNDNSIEYRIDSGRHFSSNFENTFKKILKYINSITDLKIDKDISFEQDKDIILKEFYEVNINKDAKLRLGETNIAKNGQKMTIIAYRSSIDIDVQFDDGTIVCNKKYDDFKLKNIRNPNLKQHNFIDRTGETVIATNGQKMTIIDYINTKNITIKFEDGTVLYNRDYTNFKKGRIANPNFKKVA